MKPIIWLATTPLFALFVIKLPQYKCYPECRSGAGLCPVPVAVQRSNLWGPSDYSCFTLTEGFVLQPPVASTFMPAPMGQSYSSSKLPVPPVPVPAPFLPNLYEPVLPHWFFCKLVEGREVWLPFSNYDSANLEEVYNSGKW